MSAMRTLCCTALLAVALLAGGVAPASATTVVALDDATLVASSDRVVQGAVIAIEVVRYPIAPQAFTEVTVEVEENVLSDGAPAERLIVRMPGGALDDRHIVVPGMPSFTLGERVVLFLEQLPDAFGPDAPPAYLPLGLEQGVWRDAGLGRWQRGSVESVVGPSAPTPQPVRLDTIRAWCLGVRP
jgi:hypothetical protein